MLSHKYECDYQGKQEGHVAQIAHLSPGSEVMKHFFMLNQLSMAFIMVIDVKRHFSIDEHDKYNI